MIERTVQTVFGPVEVIVHSATSAIVRAESATVNRVAVRLRVDIGPNTNPHSLIPLGEPDANHVTISKPGKFDWNASWVMRRNVGEVAMGVFNNLMADPAFKREAEIDRVVTDLAYARRDQDKAQEALDEATANVARLDKQIDALSLLQIAEG